MSKTAKPTGIKYEDIDVAAGYHVIRHLYSNHADGGAPTANMIKFAKSMKDDPNCAYNRSSDYHKIRACRHILEEIGWIECTDETYDWGRAKCYRIRECHPAYTLCEILQNLKLENSENNGNNSMVG